MKRYLHALIGSIFATGATVALAQTTESSCAPLSGLQVAAGYITTANVIKTVAGLAIAIFSIIFFHQVFLKIAEYFLKIPKWVYKALGWVASTVALGAIYWAPVDLWPHITLVGVLGSAFMGGILLSDMTKRFKHTDRNTMLATSMVALGLSGVYIFIAPKAQSQLSMMFAALTMTLGLFMLMLFIINSKKDSFRGGAFLVFLSATLSGLAMLYLPHLMGFTNLAGGFGLLFSQTAFWVASITLTIFALRVAMDGYELAQIATIVILGLLFGLANISPSFANEALLQFAGTALILYILSKPIDIPFQSVIAWSACGLVLSLVVFALMRAITMNPQFWTQYLLM